MTDKFIVECIDDSKSTFIKFGQFYYASNDEKNKNNYVINLLENNITIGDNKGKAKTIRQNMRFSKKRFRKCNSCKIWW